MQIIVEETIYDKDKSSEINRVYTIVVNKQINF